MGVRVYEVREWVIAGIRDPNWMKVVRIRSDNPGCVQFGSSETSPVSRELKGMEHFAQAILAAVQQLREWQVKGEPGRDLPLGIGGDEL